MTRAAAILLVLLASVTVAVAEPIIIMGRVLMVD
jgi:hypothetical protein